VSNLGALVFKAIAASAAEENVKEFTHSDRSSLLPRGLLAQRGFHLRPV
jgi:hypothetical protein